MLNVKEMQDNIINMFGLEHPNTEYFFKFCDNFRMFEDIIEQEYYQILSTSKIVADDYTYAHIHINVCDGYTDNVIRALTIEFKGEQFNSHIDIIKAIENSVLSNGNDYISIMDVIVE